MSAWDQSGSTMEPPTPTQTPLHERIDDLPSHALSRSDLMVEINDLRGRLDRRNLLLDAIRKAYHRDVLVVKECLIDAERRNAISSTENGRSSLTSSLSSVPSIDLRKTFRLFAPQECEMRVHPCWSCGGQLEVIHRESARIVEFKHSIQMLEEKEHDLRLELIDTKVRAQEDRSRLVDVMTQCRDEREVLLEQIVSMKHQVADRNALDAEVKRLAEEKECLEMKLEEQKPILIEHDRLKVEIEEVKGDAAQWRIKFHQQLEENENLHREKSSLVHQVDCLSKEKNELQHALQTSAEHCHSLEASCSSLTLDLSKSRSVASEMEACLHKAEHAMTDLEAEFEAERQRFQQQISGLESKCTDLSTEILELDEKASQKADEAEYYRSKIEATLEAARSRENTPSLPVSSDSALDKTDELIRETENLRKKFAASSNLLVSCVRATYDNCLLQEKILLNNGSELHRNTRWLKKQLETTNKMSKMVLEHLGSAAESDAIEWKSILDDETDQRHILGNLQNRLQMGQFSLEKCFEKVNKSHSSEMRKRKEEYCKQIEERNSRIWELEKLLTEAIAVNRGYEKKFHGIREKHDSLKPMIDYFRRCLRQLSRDCSKNHDTTIGLKQDYIKLRAITETVFDQLKAYGMKNCTLEESVIEKQHDIDDRDKAIEQLEKFLESITQKYASALNKPKVDAEVQAVPEIADASSHADFLFTPSRGVTAASEDMKLGEAPLQGRIWPSFIDIGKGIPLRRAIDKL